MSNNRTYPGIDKDMNGGISDTGRIIRDAWVFGILDENETCGGWSYNQIMALYDKVYAAWEPYGHLVSNLPAEVRKRHQTIYAEAVRHARAQGWDPELGPEE